MEKQKKCPKCGSYNVSSGAGISWGIVACGIILGFFGLFLPLLLIPAFILIGLGILAAFGNIFTKEKNYTCLNCHYGWTEGGEKPEKIKEIKKKNQIKPLVAYLIIILFAILIIIIGANFFD